MNTSKQINVMIGLMFLTFVVVGGYFINESNRQEVETEEITERNAERGARLFVNNCRSCHGLEGEGFIGPALDSDAFLILGADNAFGLEETPGGDAANVRTFLRETISCGRVGTAMPRWAQTFGGSLSDTQVEHLVTLITNDPTGKEDYWDLVREAGEEADEEIFGSVLEEESAIAAVLRQRLGREPTLDEVRNPDVALLVHADGRALADLTEDEREKFEDQADALPEDARFELTEEQLEEFGRQPTAGQMRALSEERTLVDTGPDAGTLSVTQNVCGQFTSEAKATARSRDPFGAAPPVTATPTGTATGTATPPPAGDGVRVAVELSEFAIAVDPTGAASGTISFSVANAGGVFHNLRVIRSDAAPDALPVEAGQVPEGQVGVVGRIEEFAGGGSESITLDLGPGSYLLICNVAGHYQLGMTTAFTVQ